MAIHHTAEGGRMSSLIYLVVSEKGELKSFTSLEEAKKYAVSEGIFWVRRFRQSRVGKHLMNNYYEIAPVEIKNRNRRAE